jgi:hypothetical protein
MRQYIAIPTIPRFIVRHGSWHGVILTWRGVILTRSTLSFWIGGANLQNRFARDQPGVSTRLPRADRVVRLR